MLQMQNIVRDFQIIEDLSGTRKPKIYKERYKPFELSDEEFYSRYRFDKITAQYIIDLVSLEEPNNRRGLPIPANLQVLTALRFFGRNAHQSDIADLHGMSQATVGRIIKTISKKIALLLPHFIHFPRDSELSKIKNGFYQLARFPTVIGAIDCTHVRIKCPAKNVGQEMAGHYLNRKGYYSLNVQIVCDADCRILDIVARSRGSKHDSRIWNECQLKHKLELTKNDHNGVLLGDGGYPVSPILLTPLRNPTTPKEERYNTSHIATRSKVECLNGQLKSKFRSIFGRIRVSLDTAKNIVVAVAVLHNIAKERNLSILDTYPEGGPELISINLVNISTNNSSNSTATNSGNAYRTAFINTYF